MNKPLDMQKMLADRLNVELDDAAHPSEAETDVAVSSVTSLEDRPAKETMPETQPKPSKKVGDNQTTGSIHPILIAVVMFAIAGIIAFSQDFNI